MAITNCCCCFQLKSGVKYMGFIFAYFSIIGVGVGIWSCQKVGESGLGLIITSLVRIITNVMLAAGCDNQNRNLFLPWLILEMTNIVAAYITGLIIIGIGISDMVTIDQVDDVITLSAERMMRNWQNALYSMLDYKPDESSELQQIGEELVISGVIIVVLTSVMTYFWAVVKTLHNQMGTDFAYTPIMGNTYVRNSFAADTNVNSTNSV